MSEPMRGSCLCGAVQFEVTAAFEKFYWCHCSRCRKETGSAHASNLFTAPQAVRWLRGRETLKRFDLATAKSFSRAFCSECGAPMPYVNRAGTHLVVPAGALDAEPPLRPQDQLHWASRAGWYEPGLAATRCQDEPAE